MTDPENLAPWLRRFPAECIVTERGLARLTRCGYRDTFVLLVPFIGTRARKPPGRLTLDDLSSRRVPAFLDHLEEARGCSVQTRNRRLSAIRALAGIKAGRQPARPEWASAIRAIAVKKATPQPVGRLGKDEMTAMLAVPDRRRERGRVEHALLLFLRNTGARVSGATALTVGDLEFGGGGERHGLVTLHGKGGKRRQCPLWPRTEAVLAELVAGRVGGDGENAVFPSRHRQPCTRHGIYRLVERCAARVPALGGRKITPHQLRHSCACHLLGSGARINTIRAWLGHAGLETTGIHAGTDPGMKAGAMALTDAAEPGPDRPWKEKKGLMAFLEAL